MILTHSFLQRLQYFRAQIARELLGGKYRSERVQRYPLFVVYTTNNN